MFSVTTNSRDRHGRDDVHRDTAPQQMRDLGMPQALKGDMRHAGGSGFARELCRERTRRPDVAVPCWEDQITRILAKPESP
jgi:hypothetical protein